MEADLETDGLMEAEGEIDEDSLTEGETLALALADGLIEADGEMEADSETEGEIEADSDIDGEIDADSEAEGEILALSVIPDDPGWITTVSAM